MNAMDDALGIAMGILVVVLSIIIVAQGGLVL